MHRVCLEAEREYFVHHLTRRSEVQEFLRVDEAIAMAAIYTAGHLKVKAIAALTQSGTAALRLARGSVEAPIYALSPEKVARRKLTLLRGVYPYPIDQAGKSRDQILRAMEQVLLSKAVVQPGDRVLLTFGEPIGNAGGTNTLRIVEVGREQLS